MIFIVYGTETALTVSNFQLQIPHLGLLNTGVSYKSIQIYQTKYQVHQKHRFLLILINSSKSVQLYGGCLNEYELIIHGKTFM